LVALFEGAFTSSRSGFRRKKESETSSVNLTYIVSEMQMSLGVNHLKARFLLVSGTRYRLRSKKSNVLNFRALKTCSKAFRKFPYFLSAIFSIATIFFLMPLFFQSGHLLGRCFRYM
jgi:hypothetical protein